MSWHNRDCSIPDLDWRDGYPICIRCKSSASSIANGAAETPPPPAPPPTLKRSQLRCSWPPCVEYSETFIDEDGNDVTAFITENIDTWDIDATDPPDDQASFQEERDASQQTDRMVQAPELSMAFSNITTSEIPDEVAERTLNKTHTDTPDSISVHRSDRIHESLSGSDNFRLLRLHGSVSSNDPIHCSIEVAQLEDPDVPLYEALSYTWADLDGDKRNCMPIYIGKHFDVLLVTKNCESALRRLRKRSDRLLWIDSICIDQNNSRERSAQVTHMDKIYSIASRVLIYLGEPSSGPGEALTAVNTCASPSDTQNDAAFLVELAKRPYFKRLWVIQEVGLATRASVIYGVLIMHWTDLCSAFQSCGAAPQWIKHFSAPVQRRREAPSVFELLLDTKGALCNDPRDRLFGIIGLANTRDKELLLTDYSLSAQQLYTGLAAYWIQDRDYRFLNLAYGQKKIIPGLPSWVPDWTNIKTQESAIMMPKLLIGSHYVALPRLFWTGNSGQRFRSCPIDAFIVNKPDLLMSTPLVNTFGALVLDAIPLFRISRGELMTHGVASGMRITNWRMNHDSNLFSDTHDFEIWIILNYYKPVVLRKHRARDFSFHGFISITVGCLLDSMWEIPYWTIHSNEKGNLQRWLNAVLGLHLSSKIVSEDLAGKESAHGAAIFPELFSLWEAEESLREEYPKSAQINFNSSHIQAMDLMRTIMINAIDPQDLAWRSLIPLDFRRPSDTLRLSVERHQLFPDELSASHESVEEQISTWSTNVSQLRSYLQEQESFSDAFRDLQQDDHFNPIFRFDKPISRNEAELLREVLGIADEPRLAHLSLFLRKAYSVISSATLDEKLPWDYNRDRFLMCMLSFDLIVRLRLLLADRQLYSHMKRSIMASRESPNRIMIV